VCSVSLPRIVASGLLLGMVLSVFTCSFHNMVELLHELCLLLTTLLHAHTSVSVLFFPLVFFLMFERILAHILSRSFTYCAFFPGHAEILSHCPNSLHLQFRFSIYAVRTTVGSHRKLSCSRICFVWILIIYCPSITFSNFFFQNLLNHVLYNCLFVTAFACSVEFFCDFSCYFNFNLGF
jgi:hypothetical protein